MRERVFRSGRVAMLLGLLEDEKLIHQRSEKQTERACVAQNLPALVVVVVEWRLLRH
jgi:hypothetical protein